MKDLYQFLKEKYNQYECKDEIDFDEFIEGFLQGSFGIEAIREAFWCDEYLGTFNMNFEIDHEKQEIKLLFG